MRTPTFSHSAHGAWLAAFVVSTLGCGDDSASSSSVGGGAASNATSTSSTSGPGGDGGQTGQGAGSSGDGGSGGGPGAGGDGASGGGSSGVPLGGPCLDDDDCADELCLSEVEHGNPGGTCARRCDPATPDTSCPEGECEPRPGLGNVCIVTCDPADADCRDGYVCRPEVISETHWSCRHACDDDDDCEVAGRCVEAGTYGRCALPEAACGDLLDEDDDELIDCMDPDCAGDAVCAGGDGSFGDPCTTHADCELGMLCAVEGLTGWPGGMCVIPGTEEDCPEDSFTVSVQVLEITSFRGCTPPCEVVDECRDGYRCQAVCQPSCTSDDVCTTTGHCDLNEDQCRFPEICNDGINNDLGGAVDCEDTACISVCEQAFTDQCAAAVPLPESGTFEAAPGQNSHCGGIGSEQSFFSFTAPSNGTLTIEVEADTPHWLGVYRQCAQNDWYFCDSNGTPFTDGTVTMRPQMNAGDTWFVSVASIVGGFGSYELTSSFEALE